MKKVKIQNPILRGVHPDPSICRYGKYYYMVTSSFASFPGIPIYRSEDMLCWECLGCVLNRRSQAVLDGCRMSHGIWAPTIRCHKGVFYVSASNVTYEGNFYVTTKMPEGEWSEPHWIKGMDSGIDPELFFDEDGSVYVISASPYGSNRYKKQVIIAAQLDLETDYIIGEPWVLWDGALNNAKSPEAPHIYKKDGWYYLISSEGGTEFYHCITVSRSRNIRQKFEGYEGNPILTHRHLGKECVITGVGHGDLIQTPFEQWYMVVLGMRNNKYHFQSIGRETFMVPVKWEDGWPVVENGIVEETCEIFVQDNRGDIAILNTGIKEYFNTEKLNSEWTGVGIIENGYTTSSNGLIMYAHGDNTYPEDRSECGYLHKHFELMSKERPASNRIFNFIGHVQKDFCFEMTVKLKFEPKKDEKAGIIFLQNNFNQIKLQVSRDGEENRLRLIKVVTFVSDSKAFAKDVVYNYDIQVIEDVVCEYGEVYLKFIVIYGSFTAKYSYDGVRWILLKKALDGWYLGKRENTGFIGAKIGMFCCGRTDENDEIGQALFEWYEYKPTYS